MWEKEEARLVGIEPTHSRLTGERSNH